MNQPPTDYRALSADALLDLLEHAGRAPDIELIQVCLERLAELRPTLLEWLVRPNDALLPRDDPQEMAPLHAGHLLIAARDPAALPAFAQLYHRDDPFTERLTEWFDTALPNYGPAALPMLIGLLDDPTMPEEPQSSVIQILATIATWHPEVSTSVVERLRALLPPFDPATGTLEITPQQRNEPPLIWTFAIEGLAELRDVQSQVHIQAMYQHDLLDDGLSQEQTYLHHLNRPHTGATSWFVPEERFDLTAVYEEIRQQEEREAEARALLAELERQREQQRQQELRRAGASAQRAAKRAPQPTPPAPAAQGTVVRTTPKVGRNDPCPCGSGRKYKHCHGK